VSSPACVGARVPGCTLRRGKGGAAVYIDIYDEFLVCNGMGVYAPRTHYGSGRTGFCIDCPLMHTTPPAFSCSDSRATHGPWSMHTVVAWSAVRTGRGAFCLRVTQRICNAMIRFSSSRRGGGGGRGREKGGRSHPTDMAKSSSFAVASFRWTWPRSFPYCVGGPRSRGPRCTSPNSSGPQRSGQ